MKCPVCGVNTALVKADEIKRDEKEIVELWHCVSCTAFFALRFEARSLERLDIAEVKKVIEE